jgi:hypothetical protein
MLPKPFGNLRLRFGFGFLRGVFFNGYPQCGHASARSDTFPAHSGQVVSAILSSSFKKMYKNNSYP